MADRFDSLGLSRLSSELPAPGHWHMQGFVGATGSGGAMLGLADRRAALTVFVEGGIVASIARLKL